MVATNSVEGNKMFGPLMLCLLLLHIVRGTQGLMCPAGTFALPALDSCFFVSTKTMNWDEAVSVI